MRIYFLWGSIKNYQNDLKKSLVALIKQEIVEGKSGIKYSGEKDITLEHFQDTNNIFFIT
jgi:hypothetical protein